MRRAKRQPEAKAIASKKRQVRTDARQSGYGYHIPPEPEFLNIYFDQKGYVEQAEPFYRHYQNHGWNTMTGTPIRNWKVLAADWIFEHRQRQKRQARLSKYSSII